MVWQGTRAPPPPETQAQRATPFRTPRTSGKLNSKPSGLGSIREGILPLPPHLQQVPALHPKCFSTLAFLAGCELLESEDVADPLWVPGAQPRGWHLTGMGLLGPQWNAVDGQVSDKLSERLAQSQGPQAGGGRGSRVKPGVTFSVISPTKMAVKM